MNMRVGTFNCQMLFTLYLCTHTVQPIDWVFSTPEAAFAEGTSPTLHIYSQIYISHFLSFCDLFLLQSLEHI